MHVWDVRIVDHSLHFRFNLGSALVLLARGVESALFVKINFPVVSVGEEERPEKSDAPNQKTVRVLDVSDLFSRDFMNIDMACWINFEKRDVTKSCS